jgi:hypothetical protein
VPLVGDGGGGGGNTDDPRHSHHSRSRHSRRDLSFLNTTTITGGGIDEFSLKEAAAQLERLSSTEGSNYNGHNQHPNPHHHHMPIYAGTPPTSNSYSFGHLNSNNSQNLTSITTCQFYDPNSIALPETTTTTMSLVERRPSDDLGHNNQPVPTNNYDNDEEGGGGGGIFCDVGSMHDRVSSHDRSVGDGSSSDRGNGHGGGGHGGGGGGSRSSKR